eukprot:m.184217 g.184217  ORF g.184217 m.184217 type:complete len:89 (+) comp16664_c1_seq6:543-809(+)
MNSLCGALFEQAEEMAQQRAYASVQGQPQRRQCWKSAKNGYMMILFHAGGAVFVMVLIKLDGLTSWVVVKALDATPACCSAINVRVLL